MLGCEHDADTPDVPFCSPSGGCAQRRGFSCRVAVGAGTRHITCSSLLSSLEGATASTQLLLLERKVHEPGEDVQDETPWGGGGRVARV